MAGTLVKSLSQDLQRKTQSPTFARQLFRSPNCRWTNQSNQRT